MRNILIATAIAILMFMGCGIFQPKPISISQSDLESYPNLIQASPDYYLEFIGLKNFTAQQIVDTMRLRQGDSITGARVLNACSAVMQHDLGFEYSSTTYVRPNYGYITLIENKADYGILEKELPDDSLDTISEWNIPGKDLHDFANQNALAFYLQFLRTDGNELSMKYKIVYNKFADDEEKTFTDGLLDHINGLDMNSALPQARNILSKDANLVNRYWALLILMRSEPTDEDLKLIFDQYYYNNNSLKNFTSYVLRETLKLRPDFEWKYVTEPVKNLISGSAIWDYDIILQFLTDFNFPSKLSDEILDHRSPILHDYLNAHESDMSELAFNFLKNISEEDLDNKKEANQWLTSQYLSTQ